MAGAGSSSSFCSPCQIAATASQPAALASSSTRALTCPSASISAGLASWANPAGLAGRGALAGWGGR